MPEEENKKEEILKKKNESQENEEGIEKRKFPSWLKWMLIVLTIVLVAGGAFALTKYVIMPKYFSHMVNQALDEKVEKKGKGIQEKEEIGFIHNITGIVVNAKDSQGRRFIVAEYAVETSEKQVVEELKNRDPQIRNEIITFLRGHTIEQVLANPFQEISKTYLKNAINSRLNSGEIDSVYYTQLIIQ